MQTWASPWAKRSVRAALVTGGMLAAGTGVASASDHCPDRPAPPLGESALAPAKSPSLRHGVPCFAGELFPEFEPAGKPHGNAAPTTPSADHPITALSGTLDPQLPEPVPRSTEPTNPASLAEDRPGKTILPADRIPADTEPRHARSIDVEPGESDILFGLIPLSGSSQRQLPPSGTPSQGFHRSLSWSGGVNDLLDTVPMEAITDTVEHRMAGLVRPSADPAVFDGFAEPDSIVGLWQGSLGRGLLTPDAVDLTTTKLTEPRAEFHSIPAHLLDLVTDSTAPAEPRRETVPLEVPGEHQLRAGEIPSLLNELKLLDISKAPGTVEREADSGLHTPLPIGGELNALGGGESSVPIISNITKALEGDPAATAEPRLSRDPLASPVVVTTVDELTTATPVRNRIARNPFPTAHRASAMPEMRLPRGDESPLPNITAVQGETLPTLEVHKLLGSLDTTMPLPRLTSNA